jgi:predicted RNA-binding protein with TRAM domain
MSGDFGNRGFGQRDRFSGGRSFGGSRGGGYERTPPVKEGEELDVRIEAVGEKGDGVAKKDGFVIFVPNVKAGDEVRVRITKVLRKVGFAEMIGAAQGPVAQQAPPKQQSAAEAKVNELQKVAAQAKTMEDSEDFGDEEAPPADEPEETVDDEPEAPVAKPAKAKPATVEDVPEEEAPADEEPEAPVVKPAKAKPAASAKAKPAAVEEEAPDQSAAIDDELEAPSDPEPDDEKQ